MLFEAAVVLVKGLILISILMGAFGYMTWLERIVMARVQLRLGPTRVGPLGLFQPLADGIKLLTKESFQPAGVDNFTYWLAPCISLFTALFVFVLIPVGGTVELFGHAIDLKIADVQCWNFVPPRLLIVSCLWSGSSGLVLKQPLLPFGRFARHSSDDQL